MSAGASRRDNADRRLARSAWTGVWTFAERLDVGGVLSLPRRDSKSSTPNKLRFLGRDCCRLPPQAGTIGTGETEEEDNPGAHP
jgi:hypothetical protein